MSRITASHDLHNRIEGPDMTSAYETAKPSSPTIERRDIRVSFRAQVSHLRRKAWENAERGLLTSWNDEAVT